MKPLPALFWTWARWRLGHGPFKPFGPRSMPHRPKDLPWAIPPRWWLEYRRRFVPPPPEPQVEPPRSVFEGVWFFTAHDPRAALALSGLADGVIVKADGGDRADPAIVPELRAAGFKVAVWEAWPTDANAICVRYGVKDYCGQAEGPGELASALSATYAHDGPKALVTNVFMERWPGPDWFCFGEAYLGTNPQATPAAIEYEARKRGAARYSPTFSLYDGSSEVPGGRKVPLREYLTQHWHGKTWSAYTAEYLDADDISYLREWRAA